MDSRDAAWAIDAIRADTAWLRRLARALVGPDDADDVAQEAWLAGLRRAPERREGLRGWLRVVATNVARKERRRRGRARAREAGSAALAPAAAVDAETLALRLEAQRLVGELALALDEPLRSTVLLCYYEGLTPSQIAARQGVPAGTVRWRLKQARDRLRAGLAARHAGRGDWRVLLAPLPGRGRRAPWKEIIAVKTTTKGAIAVVALAVLLGVRGSRRPSRTGVPATVGAVAAQVAPRGSAPGREAAVPSSRPPARVRVPRFVAPVPASPATPSAVRPPALPRGGGGLKDRRPHPPPGAAAQLARAHELLDTMFTRAEPCLAGWRAIDPSLAGGVMLRIEIDRDGLQDVSIEGRPSVPDGPLRCFSDAVYGIDWGGVASEPATLSVPLRYERDGGAPR